MSAPTCSKCHTTMEPSNGIGTNGYYCPNPSCSADNGPQIILRFHGGARAVRELTICYWEILSAQCSRCGLRYNHNDPSDRSYHTLPGGCR